MPGNGLYPYQATFSNVSGKYSNLCTCTCTMKIITVQLQHLTTHMIWQVAPLPQSYCMFYNDHISIQ